MTELPDDELDKLFRKSSEELDPQFDPEDWANMNKRLDQHHGRTGGAWLRKWWPLGVLALLLSVGVVVYRFTHEGEKSASLGGVEEGGRRKEVVVPKSKGTNAIVKENTKKLPRSLAKTGGVYLEPDRSKTGGGDGAFSIEKTREENAGAEAIAAKGSLKATYNAPLAKQRLRKTGATRPDALNAVETANQQNTKVFGTSSSSPLVVNADAEADLNRQKAVVSNAEVLPLGSRGGDWAHALQMPGIVVVEDSAEAATPEKPRAEMENGSKWAVRFGYSPDLSTVGLKDFTKPGTSVSLLAEYAILNRLYIQSGAVWSRKQYFGEGYDYRIPKDVHDYGPDILSVDGMCRVLEVPVNLRLDIVKTRRSIFFAGAGVSSYHMDKEKYNYNYQNENDPKIKYRGWKGETGWYWLSHLNASVGYEYRVSNKFSLLAEPYLRAPLKRVGYGKVNLFTTGLWISVRFKPAFR